MDPLGSDYILGNSSDNYIATYLFTDSSGNEAQYGTIRSLIKAYGGSLSGPITAGTSEYYYATVGSVTIKFYVKVNGISTKKLTFTSNGKTRTIDTANIVFYSGTNNNYVSVEYFQKIMCDFGNSLVLGVPNPVVTKKQLEDFFEKANHFQSNAVTDAMVADLNRVLEKYGITSKTAIQMFMANIAHESKTALIQGGGAQYTTISGQQVDVRGGGYMQLTGKNNYSQFMKQMLSEGLATEENGVNSIVLGNNAISGGAAYIAEYYAWESAGWYWKAANCNRLLSKGASFLKICQVINGGEAFTGTPNGWEERQKFYEMAKTIFK